LALPEKTLVTLGGECFLCTFDGPLAGSPFGGATGYNFILEDKKYGRIYM